MKVPSSSAVAISVVLLAVVAAACGTGTQATTSAPRPSTGRAPCRPDAPCPLFPEAFRTAYGIQPLLDRGIDGRGETVVLLERAASAGPPPNITSIKEDLGAYDRRFGLPPAHLSFLTSLASPAAAAYADPEEVLDV